MADPHAPSAQDPPDARAVLDALLHSVSHDLRSPLLTLTLSAELMADALPAADSRARMALEGMKHGAKDMERMLDAVTAISRARRRPLEGGTLPLLQLLGGRVVVSDHHDLDRVVAAVDARVVRELVAALAGDNAGGLQLEVQGGAVPAVRIEAPLPAECPDFEGSAVEALLGSLQANAGTPLVALAALQVQLERQGGSLAVEARRACVRLPLVSPA